MTKREIADRVKKLIAWDPLRQRYVVPAEAHMDSIICFLRDLEAEADFEATRDAFARLGDTAPKAKPDLYAGLTTIVNNIPALVTGLKPSPLRAGNVTLDVPPGSTLTITLPKG